MQFKVLPITLIYLLIANEAPLGVASTVTDRGRDILYPVSCVWTLNVCQLCFIDGLCQMPI